ncbi:MAG: cytochrome c3 family protein [Phycisphaerae bacterium]|nr:cytochrome c3 family protein [Phycisphaerae bacterium]
MKALFPAMLGLTLLGTAWAALALPGPPASPLEHPAVPSVADSVTSFANGHPEFAALRDGRKDPGTITFNHRLHLDPDSTGMQESLLALPVAMTGHVASSPGGRLTMTCAACHRPASDGGRMSPIRFEAHCAACHQEGLGTIDVAKGLVPAVKVPHASVNEISELFERLIAQRLVIDPARFAIPTAATADDAKKEEPGGRSGRRGRGGESAAGKSSESGAESDPPPTFKSSAEARTWTGAQRIRGLARIASNCGKCHRIKDAPELDADDPKAGLFEVLPSAIPAAWLPRAFYSHASHAMLACTECHAAAPAASATADVMLPSIASCRTCHGGAGAPSDCVTCHIYHPRLPSTAQGAKRIRDVLGRSAPRAERP